MENYKNIVYEKNKGVATVTLNRPNKMNALNIDLLLELKEAMTDANEDKAVRVVIITGKGRGFCAGADLSTVDEPTVWILMPNRNFTR